MKKFALTMNGVVIDRFKTFREASLAIQLVADAPQWPDIFTDCSVSYDIVELEC